MTKAKGQGKFKGTGVHDIIECRVCGKRMERRYIEEHFQLYKVGKDGYPNHPNTSNKTYELEDPTKRDSKILKTKPISNFFTPIKSKKTNQC